MLGGIFRTRENEINLHFEGKLECNKKKHARQDKILRKGFLFVSCLVGCFVGLCLLDLWADTLLLSVLFFLNSQICLYNSCFQTDSVAQICFLKTSCDSFYFYVSNFWTFYSEDRLTISSLFNSLSVLFSSMIPHPASVLIRGILFFFILLQLLLPLFNFLL
jgi:hypothetical protein